ncbi:MAG: hypothetical protein WA129_04140 [Acidovorax sp.]
MGGSLSRGALLSHLPAYPGSLLLVTALNLALARHLPVDVGQLMLHKKMHVQVRDARLVFDFAWTGQRFAPRAPLVTRAVADVTLSAAAHDFLLLASVSRTRTPCSSTAACRCRATPSWAWW